MKDLYTIKNEIKTSGYIFLLTRESCCCCLKVFVSKTHFYSIINNLLNQTLMGWDRPKNMCSIQTHEYFNHKLIYCQSSTSKCLLSINPN